MSDSHKKGMTMDLRTILTLVVLVFGAGGGWWSLKAAVDDVKTELALVREGQAVMDNKLDALTLSDGITGERITTMRRDIDRNSERIGP